MPTYRQTRAGDGLRETFARNAASTAEELGFSSYSDLEKEKGVEEASALVQARVEKALKSGRLLPHESRLTDGLPGDYTSRTELLEENE